MNTDLTNAKFLKSLRSDTNYSNLRFMIEFGYWMSWALAAIVLLDVGIQIYELSKDIYTHNPMVVLTLAAIVGFAIWVLLVVLIREALHMIVDMADAAVRTSLESERQSREYRQTLERWSAGSGQ